MKVQGDRSFASGHFLPEGQKTKTIDDGDDDDDEDDDGDSRVVVVSLRSTQAN